MAIPSVWGKTKKGRWHIKRDLGDPLRLGKDLCRKGLGQVGLVFRRGIEHALLLGEAGIALPRRVDQGGENRAAPHVQVEQHLPVAEGHLLPCAGAVACRGGGFHRFPQHGKLGLQVIAAVDEPVVIEWLRVNKKGAQHLLRLQKRLALIADGLRYQIGLRFAFGKDDLLEIRLIGGDGRCEILRLAHSLVKGVPVKGERVLPGGLQHVELLLHRIPVEQHHREKQRKHNNGQGEQGKAADGPRRPRLFSTFQIEAPFVTVHNILPPGIVFLYVLHAIPFVQNL